MPQSPDLTGTNAAYLVSNDVYTVFVNNQTINFDVPVFLTSLVITSGNTQLLFNSDWVINIEDYTSMSKMKNLDTAFNAVLVTSIKIISTQFTQPYQIACTYQGLYEQPSNVVAEGFVAPKLLPVDTNETNVQNLINNEVYSINTFANQNLIIPVSGPFFADSVVLSLPTNPVTPLVAGTDYILIGCDLTLTRSSSNTSGVYRAILFTRAYAGNVLVTYHAYGGGATLADMNAMWVILYNLLALLNGGSFLTPSLLGNSSIITSILNRLSVLEAEIASGSAGNDELFSQQVTGVTANGPFITLPAGAVIIAAQIVETTGVSINVSLGSTPGGTDILSSVALSGAVPVSMLGTSLDDYSFATNQPIYVTSSAWSGGSVNVVLWYVVTPTVPAGNSALMNELTITGATANGQFVTIPADAIIISIQLLETTGHDVTVTLGTTLGASDVLAATDISPSSGSNVSMLGTALQEYSFATNQTVYLSSTSWNGASVNMKVWYVVQ